MFQNTGKPFPKFTLHYLACAKDLHQCPFSLSERSAETISFFLKRQKVGISFSMFVFRVHPRSGSGPPAPSSGTTLSIWVAVIRAVSCVCEQLGLISIYFVQQDATCGNWFFTICHSSYERFHSTQRIHRTSVRRNISIHDVDYHHYTKDSKKINAKYPKHFLIEAFPPWLFRAPKLNNKVLNKSSLLLS